MVNLKEWGRGKRLLPPARKAQMERLIKLHSEQRRRKRKLAGVARSEEEFVWKPILGKAEKKPAVKQIKVHQDRIIFEDIDLFVPHAREPVSPFYSGRGFGANLQKRGFKLIGQGLYSCVYHKEGSSRVIKVSTNMDNWVDYILWSSKKGYAGKFSPMIYSYKVIKGHQQSFYVAVMEKLETTLGRLKGSHDHTLTDKIFERAVKYENPKALILLDMLQPGMNTFAEDFRYTFANKDYNLDLHGGNFMLNKEGSVILTDPVTGTRKYSGTRLRHKDLTPERLVA